MYTLIRTTPEGVERIHSPQPKLRDATISAAYVLYDNARVSKADAQRFSVVLSKAPLGEVVTHEESGYSFRIVNGPRWRVMKGDELIGRAEQWSNDRNVINPEDPKSVGDWQYLALGSEWSHTGSQELREVEPGVRAVYAIREPWDRMAGYKHEDTGIRIVDAWQHGQ